MGVLITLCDFAALYVANIAAFVTRFGLAFPENNYAAAMKVLPFAAIAMLIIVHLFDLHRSTRLSSVSELATSIGLSNILLGIVYLALSFWFRQFALPRSIVALACIWNASFQVVSRLTVRRLHQQTAPRATLIIGSSEPESRHIASQLQRGRAQHTGSIIITFPPYPNLDTMLANVDGVIIGSTVDKVFRGLVMTAALTTKKRLQCVPDGSDLLSITPIEEPIGEILSLSYLPFEVNQIHLCVKRLIDIVFSLGLLALLSIPMFLLLIAIPLSSKGSPIYVQTRIGRNGHPFQIYKLRSMVQGAEKQSGAILASIGDARITPLGRFIRSTRLDEVPQLWNVLKGDMSLIGPRPERPEFVATYEQVVPHYGLRHLVRPGITGLAQVKGDYSTDTPEKLRYDLWYIRHYNPLLDLKILFQTAVVVLHPVRARGLEIRTNADHLGASIHPFQQP